MQPRSPASPQSPPDPEPADSEIEEELDRMEDAYLNWLGGPDQ